jgi:hypothetical protein
MLIVYVIYKLFVVPVVVNNRKYQNLKNEQKSENSDKNIEYTDYEEVD